MKLAFSFFDRPAHFDVADAASVCELLKVERAAFETELLEIQAQMQFEEQEHMNDRKWMKVDKPTLREAAIKVLSMFGSTWTCESTFSTMKVLKNKQRSRLLHENLERHLLCAVTNLMPRLTDLTKGMQCQVSH